MTRRRYGGKTSQERDAERRGRLIAAGLELFGTVGFRGTSIQRLCTEAGVTARDFYRVVGSPEALFREVYDEVAAGSFSAIGRVIEEQRDPRALVERGVEAFLDHVLSDPRRARVQCLESHAVSDEFAAHRRAVLRRFGDLLAAASANPALSSEVVSLIATGVASAGDTMVVAHLQDPQQVGRALVYQALVELIDRVGFGPART